MARGMGLHAWWFVKSKLATYWDRTARNFEARLWDARFGPQTTWVISRYGRTCFAKCCFAMLGNFQKVLKHWEVIENIQKWFENVQSLFKMFRNDLNLAWHYLKLSEMVGAHRGNYEKHLSGHIRKLPHPKWARFLFRNWTKESSSRSYSDVKFVCQRKRTPSIWL